MVTILLSAVCGVCGLAALQLVRSASAEAWFLLFLLNCKGKNSEGRAELQVPVWRIWVFVP